MSAADEVVEAIFKKVGESKEGAALANPLFSIWRAGGWEPERIDRILSTEISAE